MAFTKRIPAKQWGDPAFRVAATASDGREVRYVARGGCLVNKTSGRVTIRSAGACTITAAALGADPPASASQTFAIEKAHPVIRFGDHEVRFERPFAVDLDADVDPTIPLRYRVIHGAPRAFSDEPCTIRNGALTFVETPTLANHPDLGAACMVEVSAAEASSDYHAPRPARGLIHIRTPSFDVSVPAVPDVEWSKDADHRITIPAHEDSGDAFGIEVEVAAANEHQCKWLSTTPQDSPPRTTRYRVELGLADPSGVAYTCELTAYAMPDDYRSGNPSDGFTVTVVP